MMSPTVPCRHSGAAASSASSQPTPSGRSIAQLLHGTVRLCGLGHTLPGLTQSSWHCRMSSSPRLQCQGASADGSKRKTVPWVKEKLEYTSWLFNRLLPVGTLTVHGAFSTGLDANADDPSPVFPPPPSLHGKGVRSSWNATSLAYLGDAVWEVCNS